MSGRRRESWIAQVGKSSPSRAIKIGGKRLSLWVLLLVVVVVAAGVAAIFWSSQQGQQTSGYIFTGNGDREVTGNRIRLWTGPIASSWSGLQTEQTWSLSDNILMTVHVNVTSLTNTFYTEIILVDDETDTGFGFQLTSTLENKVRIKGWSWSEENESSTNYMDKDTNLSITLHIKKSGTNQLDFYVDGVLLGNIATDFALSGTGQFNLDVTNGSQGGNAELIINFQVQRIV